jgi:hypothetical protein
LMSSDMAVRSSRIDDTAAHKAQPWRIANRYGAVVDGLQILIVSTP